MKVGDIVNIKTIDEGRFWRGKITIISEGYSPELRYLHPIAIVEGVGNPGYAPVMEHNLTFKDGEYWEK
jgi:hypothetical protein